MATFTVDFEGRWNALPGRRSVRNSPPGDDLEPRDLVKLDDLGLGVGHGLGLALDPVPDLTLELLVSDLAEADGEGALLPADRSLKPEGVSEVVMSGLLERSDKSDPGLDGGEATVEGEAHSGGTLPRRVDDPAHPVEYPVLMPGAKTRKSF